MPKQLQISPEIRRINDVVGVYYSDESFNALSDEEKQDLRQELQDTLDLLNIFEAFGRRITEEE